MNIALYFKNRLISSLSLLTLLVVLGLPNQTFAGETDTFKGFAWSPNIGWISFNCSNTNYCDTIDYGVTARGNGTFQNVTGFGWAPGGLDPNGVLNPGLGWIDFSGATYNQNTGELEGTAVVHNTTVAPYRSGDAEDDGWDGVIDLAGTVVGSTWGAVADHSFGTIAGYSDANYSMMDGYAWGDENIGWLSFSCQSAGTCGTVEYGVFIEPFYLDFTASQGLTALDKVTHNGTFNHTWTLEPTSVVSNCIGTNGPGTWSNTGNKAYIPTPTSESVLNNTADAVSRLSCTNNNTSPAKTTVRDLPIFVAAPAPTITFTANDPNIAFNASTDLIWTTTGISSCTLDGGIFSTQSVSPGTNQTANTGSLSAAFTDYILDCEATVPADYPAGAQAVARVYVERLEMDFYAVDENGDRLDQNELVAFSRRGEINLQWDVEFASGGCSAASDWTGTKASTNGTHTETVDEVDSGNFNYTLVCNGSNGQQDTQTVSIRIGKNPTPSETISDFLNNN